MPGDRDRERMLAWSPDADTRALDEQDSVLTDSVGFDRVEPAEGDIEDWTHLYETSPLVRASINKFSRDVAAPGYRIDLVDHDDDPPQARDDLSERIDPTFGDLDLVDAIEQFLDRSVIHAGEFEHDFSELVVECVKDARGRRGTALVEHVYDNAENADFILGFRAFKAETTTAYTRPGTGILLQPGDEPDDGDGGNFTTRTVGGSRRRAPQTPAGKRAAYVQFDSVFFGGDEPESAFAVDDVTKISHDPDTGEVYGTPDTATIYDRATALKQRLTDLDHSILASAYKHWFVSVDAPQSQAEQLVSDLNPSDPTDVSVLGHELEVDSVKGDVPSISEAVHDDVEYIMAGLPTPVYQIGFANDVNRDVTGEQSPSYRELVQNERRRIEGAFNPAIQQVADQFMPEGEDAPIVELKLAPDGDLSPMDDEDFDATAFKELSDALSTAGVTMDPEYVLERWLGIDPDEAMPDTDADFGPMDPNDPAVQEQFDQMTGDSGDGPPGASGDGPGGGDGSGTDEDDSEGEE